MIWLLMLGCLRIAKLLFHVSIYDHEDLEVFMCVTLNDLVTTLKDRRVYVRNSRLVKRQPFIQAFLSQLLLSCEDLLFVKYFPRISNMYSVNCSLTYNPKKYQAYRNIGVLLQRQLKLFFQCKIFILARTLVSTTFLKQKL